MQASTKRVKDTGCQGTRDVTPEPLSVSKEGIWNTGFSQWPRLSGHKGCCSLIPGCHPQMGGSDSAPSLNINQNEIAPPTWEPGSTSTEGLGKQMTTAKPTPSFRAVSVVAYQLCLQGVPARSTILGKVLPFFPLSNWPVGGPLLSPLPPHPLPSQF